MGNVEFISNGSRASKVEASGRSYELSSPSDGSRGDRAGEFEVPAFSSVIVTGCKRTVAWKRRMVSRSSLAGQTLQAHNARRGASRVDSPESTLPAFDSPLVGPSFSRRLGGMTFSARSGDTATESRAPSHLRMLFGLTGPNDPMLKRSPERLPSFP